MAITVSSRPDDISSAYLPCEYIFTSDLSPNTVTAENSTINLIKADPSAASPIGSGALFIFNTALSNVAVGDYISISGTSPTTESYDGIRQVLDIQSATDFVLDVPFTGTNGSGGSASKFYRNFSVVADLFIGGAFKARFRTQRDSDNNFSIDTQRVIQSFLKEDLQTVGNTSINEMTDAAKTFYVKYAEEYDVPDDNGNPELTIQDFTDDSSNTKLAVNTTIPYVFLQGGEITSTTYGMGDFVLDTVNYRFLTEMPRTVKIGTNESAQLSFLISGAIFSPVVTISRRVITYDSNGAVLSTTNTSIATGSGDDKGYHIPSGTANITFASNVSKYDVLIISSSAGVISETVTFEIDRECHKVARRFHWLNSRGGIDSYTFKGKETYTQDTERNEYKRLIGSPRVLPERAWTTVRNRPSFRYMTGSGLVDKDTREWLGELLSSPNVWIEQEGEYLPVRVLSNQRRLTESDKALDNITLEWEYAFDFESQRN